MDHFVLTRTHLARSPFKLSRMETVQETRAGMKPKGLWYANESEWYNWAKVNLNMWNKYSCAAYSLNHKANVLSIRNEIQLDDFTREYGCSQWGGQTNLMIQWSEVAKKYDGIEIMDYLHNCRLQSKFFWYYSWDVGSGCIWRPKTIQLQRIPWRALKSRGLIATASAHDMNDILERRKMLEPWTGLAQKATRSTLDTQSP